MANIVDEVNRDLWNGMKNTPERLLRLIRTIQQIHDWYEKQHNTKLKDNLEDLKKSYNEQLKKLNEAEKELSEKYNVLYETAIEKENYELILPETYKQIKDDVVFNGYRKMNDIVIDEHLTSEQAKKQLPELYDKLANSYSFKDLSKDIGNNADFRQFLERYSEDYEDLNLDDFMWEDGSLKWDDLFEYTDISDDFFKPVFNAIVRDEIELHKAAEEYLFDLEATEAELMSGNLTFDDDGLEL